MRKLSLVALLLVGACAPAATTEDFDLTIGPKPDGGRCTPGETQPCVCLGGTMGTQTCRASGSSYGSCIGCEGAEADGPLPVIKDMGGNICGDCDGCCDGATCVPFANQSNTKCGGRNQTCGSCGAKICDSSTGTCVDASGGCNATSCPNGCCKDVSGTPTCFTNQPAACGTSGGTCTACTYGVLCNGGCTTTLDGNAQFKVVVSKASFYNTDVDKTSCWDNYAGFGCAKPDPEVCFGYQMGGSIVEGCTVYKSDVPVTSMLNGQDVDDVTWTDAEGLISSAGSPFLIPGSLFIQGGKVRVTLYDVDDVNSWDVIGQAYVTATSSYYSGYVLSAFGRVTSITFSLR